MITSSAVISADSAIVTAAAGAVLIVKLPTVPLLPCPLPTTIV